MNFVKQVEEQLRDLGTESRRKHPGVKEAAERAILSLRTLQNKYVVAVRKATRTRASSENVQLDGDGNKVKVSHPTTALFQSQDVLRPFLLAANYPSAGNKVLNLCLDGIQALLAGDAICKNDGVNVVRIMSIQANICAAAIQSKTYGGGGMMGNIGMGMGMQMPTAGSMVNAGVGTISSLGNSILSGFGLKGQNSQMQEMQQSMSSSSDGARSVASAVYVSNRSLKEDEAISIRILQTLTMIIDSASLELSEEVLSQCISSCLVLSQCSSESALISSSGGGNGGKQKRKDGGKSKSSGSQNSGHGSNVSHGSGIAGGQKVSGAAIATLRQIISTLFSRAAPGVDVVPSQEYQDAGDEETCTEDEEASLQSLALKTLMDICDLAECKDCGGPFKNALVGHQQRIYPPTQSACFDLLEMVLEQHAELFLNNVDGIQGDLNFFAILNERICPLVGRLLSSFMRGEHTFALRVDGDGKDQTSGNNSLQMILKLTSLTSSIIVRYGNNELLKQQCFKLLITLAKLIESATNVLRDSHEFEDGFVYNTDSKGEQNSDLMSQQHGNSYEHSQTMWVAAISIEVIYNLIADEFINLLALLSSRGNDGETETLVASIIGIICDFAVVASSCKSAISKVVVAAGDIDELGNSEIDDKEMYGTSGVEAQKSSKDIFVCDFNFDVQRIHPTLIGSAREMAGYDIGAAVWTSLNCILMLWNCLQPTDTRLVMSEDSESDRKILIDDCFAPSLAVIQHFLRRFPACVMICKSTLSGYLLLSRSVLPLCSDGDFKREVLLASLCKMTSPTWGRDESRTFQSINDMAVSLLFQVLQHNPDYIGTDWLVVVACLAKLSELTSCSSTTTHNLSKIGFFSRDFLNDDSLKTFTLSLIEFSTSSEASVSTAATSNTFGNKLYSSAQKKLRSIKMSTKPDDFSTLPFALVLLVIVSSSNYQRFHHVGQKILAHFGDQATSNESDIVRTFSLDVISYLIIPRLIANDAEKEIRVGQLGEMVLLLPLCDVIKQANYDDTVELGLVKLKQIVDDGYNLTAAWPSIIESLSTVADVPRNNGDWSVCCTTAFGCLKLIVDDFLNELPDDEITRIALLDCCASFGSSRYDINTSLTATGMLWSIADQESSPCSVDHVLSKLAFLASDDRVEVRNCVVNTLFSCVVGLGQKFTAVQWKGVFTNTIFAVLDQVKEQGTSVDDILDSQAEQENRSSERYKVSVHHSRDSRDKQWATTQVLTLRGMERVLRQFFDMLLGTMQNSATNETWDDGEQCDNWFEDAWIRMVEQCLDCSSLFGGRETLDLRLVGVELLVLCCQSSSERGFIAADARVGTNMQVVNGALRSVRSSTSKSPLPSPSRISSVDPIDDDVDPILAEKRIRLFNKAYEVLIQFGTFVKENEEIISGGENLGGYIDSLHLQVLTKLAQGLSQLYLCCKDSELSPRQSSDEREKDFVELVTLIIKMAHAGSSSKFLTQAQRQCLDILKTMSLHCSSRAFEVLAQLGSNVIFKQKIQDDIDILHSEAGKIISEICANDEVAVIVERTRTGLNARIDLPGATDNAEIEEDKSDNVSEDTFVASLNASKEQSSEISQLKEINAELMREVEKLRSQKEILGQQVAVLSEGSSYT